MSRDLSDRPQGPAVRIWLRRWGTWLLQVAVLSVTCLVLARIAAVAAPERWELWSIWPATGVGIVAVWRYGYRIAPGIWIATYAFSRLEGASYLTSLAAAFSHLAEPLIAIYLIRRYLGMPALFESARSVLYFFLFAGGAASCVGATLGVTAFYIEGVWVGQGYGSMWMAWWAGDLMGAIIVAPALLLWFPLRPMHWSAGRTQELAAALLVATAGTLAIFGGPFNWAGVAYPMVFVLLLPVLWAALRLEPRGTALVTLVTCGLAAWRTLEGRGPFAIHAPEVSLLLLQAFMAVAALNGLMLAASIGERARTAAALHTGRERMRALLDAAAQIFWTAAPDGGSREDSPSWRAFTGQSREQRLGLGWLDAVHPQDRALAQRSWSEAVRRHTRYEYQYRLRHASGEWRWMAVRAVPVLNPDGSVREWVGMNTDITDRKRLHNELEEALKSREQALALLHTIVEAAPVGVAFLDCDLRFRLVNDALAQMNGVPSAEHLGRTVGELFPDWLQSANALIRTVLEGQPVTDRLLRSGPADSEPERYRLESWYPVRAGHGEMLGIGAIVQDVTSRLAVEEALRESEERLRLALDGGKLGLWDFDPRTERVVYDEREFALLGLPRCDEQIDSAVFFERVHPDDRAPLRRRLAEVLESGRDLTQEFRVTLPDGEVRWLGAAGRVYRDAQGRAVQFVGVNFDITERKRAEQALRDADRRKDEFLAMLAHELRNPLAPLRNAMEVLRLVPGSEPKVQWVREVVDRQVTHLVRIVDELLDVARITRGVVELRKERFRLETLIQRAIEISLPMDRRTPSSPDHRRAGRHGGARGGPGTPYPGTHQSAQQCREVHRARR